VLRWFLVSVVGLLVGCGSVVGPGPGPGPDPDPGPGPVPPSPTRVHMTMAEGRVIAADLLADLRLWDVGYRAILPSLRYAACFQVNRFHADVPEFVGAFLRGTLYVEAPMAVCDELVPPEFDPIGLSAPVHIPRVERLPMNGITPAYWLWSDSPSERGPRLPFGSVTYGQVDTSFLPYRSNEFEVRRVAVGGDVQWLRGRWLDTVMLDLNDGGTWVRVPGFSRGHFSAYFVDTPVMDLTLRQEWGRNACGESEVVGWFTDDLRFFWRAADSPVDAELSVGFGAVELSSLGARASGSFRLSLGDLAVRGAGLLTLYGQPDVDEFCVKGEFDPVAGAVEFRLFEGLSHGVVLTSGLRLERAGRQAVEFDRGRLLVGSKFVNFSGRLAVRPRSDWPLAGWSFLDSVVLEFADGSLSVRAFLIQVGLVRAGEFVRSLFD
jgi:hypothetical protein